MAVVENSLGKYVEQRVMGVGEARRVCYTQGAQVEVVEARAVHAEGEGCTSRVVGRSRAFCHAHPSRIPPSILCVFKERLKEWGI